MDADDTTAISTQRAGLTLAGSYRDQNRALVAGFEQWMILRNFAASTRKQYLKTTEAFVHHIGSSSVRDKAAIRGYLAEVASAGVSLRRQSNIRYQLRCFYRFLGLAGLVSSLWKLVIPVLNVPRRIPRFLSESEVEQLLAAAGGPRDRAVVELFYASGVRLAELMNLKVEDLNFRAGSILIRSGKGNKDRIGFFGSKAGQALASYLKGRRRGPLFLGELGRRFSRNAIYQSVRRTGKRAGLVGVHPHVLRHSFATHILNRGAGIVVVQKLLGHKYLRETQRYTHLAIADLMRAHARSHPRGGQFDEKLQQD